MAYSNIIVNQESSVCTITVDRPKQLNALNRETIKELSQAFEEADKDDGIRVVIVTGSGEKAFIAGADIKEFASFNEEEGRALSADGQKLLFDRVEQMSKPVIAAVNGFALGGGLELAMSAHIRIASDNAQLGLPEVSLGVIPGYGGTQRLAHLVGKGKAIEMIVSAGMIKAEEALTWGLVNQVVSLDNLLASANKMATKIARNSPIAIGAALNAVRAGYADGVNGFETEVAEFGRCFGSEDFKEGTTAFLEKRKPDFSGQ